MRLAFLLLLLCLLPVFAMADDTEDAEDDDELEGGIVTEVEGRGNKVIVIEELVININAGDLELSHEGGGAGGAAMFRHLMQLLHGGMGPGGGARGPAMHGLPRGPQGPHGQRDQAHGRRGPEIRGNWMDMEQWSQGAEPGHPGVTDDVRGGMPHMPGGMGLPGMPAMPPMPGMGMSQMHGEMGMPDMHGGMEMPHQQGMMMPHGGMNPAVMEMMMQIPPEVDADFMRFIFGVGKLAWGDPQFRDQLRSLLRDYQQGGGGCEEYLPDRTEVR